MKRHVLSGSKEGKNKLSAQVANTPATGNVTLSFTYDLKGIKVGAFLSIDLEVFYVWSVDDSAKTAICERAMLGSTAGTHAANSVVTVDPIVHDFQIARALNQELASLSGEGLYQMKTVSLTAASGTTGYDMTSVTDIIDVYAVHWKNSGSSRNWPEIRNYKYQSKFPASGFASEKALFVYEGVTVGQTIQVMYRAPFGSIATTNDNITAVTGLHAEAHDIPPLAAAAKLSLSREVKRNFSEVQGDTRRAGEVNQGGMGNAGKTLLALRDKRVAQERTRLMSLYPPRW